MRCTHFQIHFAMIATRERTNTSAPASFTSLLQKIFFVILEQMQQAKVQNTRSQQSSNSTKVQKCKTLCPTFFCAGTEIEFPCRHRTLWKIANLQNIYKNLQNIYNQCNATMLLVVTGHFGKLQTPIAIASAVQIR